MLQGKEYGVPISQRISSVLVSLLCALIGFLAASAMFQTYGASAAPGGDVWTPRQLGTAHAAAFGPDGAPQESRQQLQQIEHVPAALTQLLVGITFQWNPAKLVYLTAVLQSLATYRTKLDVVIITDNADALRTAMTGVNKAINLANVEVWQPPTSSNDNPYWITYEHRKLIQSKVRGKEYTAVMYVEDDTYVSWPALVSWALDTEVLQHLNFTRCFYRTEVHHRTGQDVMFDWRLRENVTTMKWIDVSINEGSKQAYLGSLAQTKGKTCGQLPTGVSQPCKDSLHRYFLSPSYPFQGMWVLTMGQLREFMQHPYWTKDGTLHANLGVHNFWGYPERSNSVNLLLHVPEGYGSNCMVPVIAETGRLHTHTAAIVDINLSQPGSGNGSWDNATQAGVPWWPALPALADVRHLRNGYGGHECLAEGPNQFICGDHGEHSSIPVEGAFIA